MNGKAIKCVSMLLPKLPERHDYKVLFMTRPLGEVAASQQEMTRRLETKGADLDAEQLVRALKTHRDETLQWLRAAPHMECIEIDYPTLVRDPQPALARLAGFLGPEILPNPDAMAGVIDPSLYRKKTA